MIPGADLPALRTAIAKAKGQPAAGRVEELKAASRGLTRGSAVLR